MYLYTHTENNNSALLDMDVYSLPKKNKTVSIYPAVPRNTHDVPFDIYDYDMLFRDPRTLELMRSGNTIGCFYIESPGMRSLLKRLSVDTFEMLTAASSIIRPGVAESGMMQEFIDRHKDPSKRKYLLPEMEEILGETYGVMIYQEDVIKVAHHIAGLSLEEADLLRRAMSGKMRSHTAMQQLNDRFFESCSARGLSDTAAEELWRQIESFAGYAFCKAHSASFALLSFQVAFLKAHYPAEFISSVLSNQGGYYSAAVYIQEARRMGLTVKLPSVNESMYEYKGRGNEVRVGFLAIKNFSADTAERIVAERRNNGRYVSLADFLVRTRAGYEETALLIRCGAMDEFRQTRPTLMRLLDIYVKRRHILDDSYNDLFMNESFQMEKDAVTQRNYSLEEICVIEYETLGYMLTRHPLEFFDSYISDPAVIKAGHMHKYRGKKVKMIGWYMASKRIKTKKGEIMKFLSLEDLTGTFEAVLFPAAYSRYAESTLSMGPYLLEGRIDGKDTTNLIVEKLEVVISPRVRSVTQKDSAENKYFGDVEKISEEEFSLVGSLDREELQRAYL